MLHFRTASHPTNGSCAVSPKSGQAFITVFNISCVDWIAPQSPLIYDFSVSSGNGSDTVVSRGYDSSLELFATSSGDTDHTSKYTVTIFVLDGTWIKSKLSIQVCDKTS